MLESDYQGGGKRLPLGMTATAAMRVAVRLASE
jgi:hypothetical protein